MSAPDFDLQSHSTYSDGTLSPRDVVRTAAESGVALLALTDHDTVEGVGEALAAGRELGVQVVPAVEISAVNGDRQDLHILGYGIDHRDTRLGDRLQSYRADREHRAEAMVAAIRRLGYAVDEAALAARRAAGKPIGRPNIADAVVSMPENQERLRREGLGERSAFLVAYLIEGKPAFMLRTRPTVPEAIATIHDAGGVAVWAHPFWDVRDSDEVLAMIDRFVGWGLDGVEAFYATHDAAQTDLLVRRCRELGLLTTGSADFHGPTHRDFPAMRAFELHGHEPSLGPLR
jgi:predicted metal-dependent phosphoesterase TrpH